ncbi:MAG: succinylglutamate desuccinylase/aspartoacylase family protein [Nitrososphaerota archaeon]|nr:succinylglutamate desuccinylase/aspartoacylase family protein [Nitrososphaerota archaeon]
MNEKSVLDNIQLEDENISKAESISVNLKIIGFSEQQRPLNVVFIGQNKSELRIFIMAGQHGDEADGRKAVLRLATQSNQSYSETLSSAQLAILLDANPDGSNQATRENSLQIDLNRDHQRLDAKETRAIHDFVRLWRPHLIVDVHNYPPRRKLLLAENRIIDYDVFLDTPTNPVVNLFPNQEVVTENLVRTVKSELNSFGFSCERYLLLKGSGRARGSTLDLVDARNSLAVRYETLTILVEGRDSTKNDNRITREKLVSAQYQALRSIIRWASSHQILLTSKTIVDKGKLVPIRYKYYPSNRTFEMKYKNALTGERETVPLQVYLKDVKISKLVELPRAYAIPRDELKALKILDRHAFRSEISKPYCVEEVESYSIDRTTNKTPESQIMNRKDDNFVVKKEKRTLEGYRIFRTDQLGGPALALFLEPRSQYGLVGHGDLSMSLSHQKTVYPILRIP